MEETEIVKWCVFKVPIQYWFKTRLQQGIFEPIFYGDSVGKFKRIIVGMPNFSDQLKIIKRYKTVGVIIDIMRQSACLVLNPMVGHIGYQLEVFFSSNYP